MNRYGLNWENTGTFSGIRFTCGYCSTDTSPAHGWSAKAAGSSTGFVLICTNCNRPSFIERVSNEIVRTTPAKKLGSDVGGLPTDVESLYNEARKCTGSGAYTSAVLACRKILMHVAVEKGADKGKKFIEYVNYLADNNYIPPDGKDWVDYIRSKSNEANHEIALMELKDAEDLVSFTEMLLRLVFEFKERLNAENNSDQD